MPPGMPTGGPGGVAIANPVVLKPSSLLAFQAVVIDAGRAAVADTRRRCESESRKEKRMQATEHGDSEKGILRAKLEAAAEKAKEVGERLKEQTAAAAMAADEVVRENPYQAIGIAFSVGMLIGVLLARRE